MSGGHALPAAYGGVVQAKRLTQLLGAATGLDDFADVHGGKLNESTIRRKGFVEAFNASAARSAECAAMKNLAGKKKLTGLAMRLRPLRAQTGLTQSEVAAAVGIERSTLAGLESGAANAGRETLAALADYYKVSLDYLEKGTTAPGQELPLDTAQTEEEATLLRISRLLNKDQRNALIIAMRTVIGESLVDEPVRHTRRS